MAYEVDYSKSSDNNNKKQAGKDYYEELKKFEEWVEDAEDKTREARKFAEKCRDYYDSQQYTEDEKKTLKDRGQADIVTNRIKPKVDFLGGMERTGRTDPQAFPRNYPFDEEAAKAATDALRFIADQNNFNSKVKSPVFENMIIEGFGAGKIEVRPGLKNKKDYKILIKRVHWDRFFYDPYSREPDFSDSLYKGEYLWMELNDAISLFPKKESELRSASENTSGSTSETSDDKPTDGWCDKKRNRLKIVEIWYRKGSKENGTYKVCKAIFTRGVMLEEPSESPSIDEEGFQEDPYVAMSAYISRTNARYGVVMQYMGVQDEINKRRSKALHLLSVRQIRIDPAARSQYQSTDAARKELAKPDGVLVARQGEIEILQTNDLAMGQLQLLQDAKQEIDAVGVNAALAGKNEQAMSGIAIQSRQQGGMMELGPLFDNLRSFQKQVYVKCWNRVKQYWTEEKWIRVTDDEKNIKFVPLNKTMTYGDVYEKSQGELPKPPPEMTGQPVINQATGKPAMQNSVADIDIDIIIDEAPDTITLQQQQFDSLAKIMPTLVQSNPQSAPMIAELLFEASNIHNKDKILEKLKGGGQDPQQQAMMQQMQQMQQQMAQVMQELGVKKAAADLAKTEAETNKINADAENSRASAIKNMSEADMKQLEIAVQSQAPVPLPTQQYPT